MSERYSWRSFATAFLAPVLITMPANAQTPAATPIAKENCIPQPEQRITHENIEKDGTFVQTKSEGDGKYGVTIITPLGNRASVAAVCSLPNGKGWKIVTGFSIANAPPSEETIGVKIEPPSFIDITSLCNGPIAVKPAIHTAAEQLVKRSTKSVVDAVRKGDCVAGLVGRGRSCPTKPPDKLSKNAVATANQS